MVTIIMEMLLILKNIKVEIIFMILRELTESEKDELTRFKINTEENGHQVLLAMIAVDLMQDKAYGHPLSYSEIIKIYCRRYKYRRLLF